MPPGAQNFQAIPPSPLLKPLFLMAPFLPRLFSYGPGGNSGTVQPRRTGWPLLQPQTGAKVSFTAASVAAAAGPHALSPCGAPSPQSLSCLAATGARVWMRVRGRLQVEAHGLAGAPWGSTPGRHGSSNGWCPRCPRLSSMTGRLVVVGSEVAPGGASVTRLLHVPATPHCECRPSLVPHGAHALVLHGAHSSTTWSTHSSTACTTL